MASRTVVQFSPNKAHPDIAISPTRRQIQPSPEKAYLPCTTAIMSRESAVAAATSGSPVKKRKGHPELVIGTQFDIELGAENTTSKTLQDALATSKRIQLDYPLILNGRPRLPPASLFTDLLHLFPTTFGVDIRTPFLIFRVRVLPPKPWPLTVGGLPVRFTRDEHDPCFEYGKAGKGQKALTQFDLQNKDEYSKEILREAVSYFQTLHVKIQDIFWLGTFWQITVVNHVDLKALPSRIGSHIAYYKFASDGIPPDPAALTSKVPQGAEYDDTLYATSPNSLLRPGIMLSSSIITVTNGGKIERTFKQTTSGILVVDQDGRFYITVASHGFEDDNLVYHPNPHTGIVIGNIVDRIPNADISLVKLNKGLRYTNEIFGTIENPDGVQAAGISPCYFPHLQIGDDIWMNSPFSGGCEGTVLGLGGKVIEDGGPRVVHHHWLEFENGDEPIDGSCGSPLFDKERQVVGFFRYKHTILSDCYATEATTLREYGYEICGEEQEF